jgi:hypothetical protein
MANFLIGSLQVKCGIVQFEKKVKHTSRSVRKPGGDSTETDDWLPLLAASLLSVLGATLEGAPAVYTNCAATGQRMASSVLLRKRELRVSVSLIASFTTHVSLQFGRLQVPVHVQAYKQKRSHKH